MFTLMNYQRARSITVGKFYKCLQMLSTVLVSCLVTNLQKPSSPELEPGTDFRDYFLRSCNLPANTSTFGLVAVLLSCFVSEVNERSSPGLKPTTDFSGLWPLFP
jgi:hypothetical protein